MTCFMATMTAPSLTRLFDTNCVVKRSSSILPFLHTVHFKSSILFLTNDMGGARGLFATKHFGCVTWHFVTYFGQSYLGTLMSDDIICRNISHFWRPLQLIINIKVNIDWPVVLNFLIKICARGKQLYFAEIICTFKISTD